MPLRTPVNRRRLLTMLGASIAAPYVIPRSAFGNYIPQHGDIQPFEQSLTAGASVQAAAVPEPAAWLLLLLGLAGDDVAVALTGDGRGS